MDTKTCTSCNCEKPIEEFSWKNKSAGKRNSRCKQCYSAYNRAYYHSGEKDKQLKRTLANAKKQRTRYQEWKQQQVCCVCGESSPECLDLHHTDMSEKEYNVSHILSRRGWKAFEEEVKKCIVVCSNCHRKIHSGRIQCPVSSVD